MSSVPIPDAAGGKAPAGNSATTPLSAFDSIAHHREIMGHPAGLFVLFFTEMWERFSYYGMRSLLVLYMVDSLIGRVRDGSLHVYGFAGIQGLYGQLAAQPMASRIYGLYTFLVYFLGLFGGMIADRWLGQRKTVILGASLAAIGHFLMAIDSMFVIALACICAGIGCFKPNTTSQVANQYPPGDPRLDRAYSIYYVGVNLGAFIAPFICGTLGQRVGWHYGFGAAGVGMLCGLLLYLWGGKFLAKDQLTRTKQSNSEQAPLSPRDWKVIGGLVILMLLNVVFWGVYEQQGNTMQIFADRNTDWHIFGWEMPSTWFQAINSMFIFGLTPLLTALWTRQAIKKTEPGTITKMTLGCVFLGVSFLPLMWVARGLGETQRISFLWLVLATAVVTLGELFLSPTGYSLVTKVAPPRLVGALMGMWFMANAFGNYMSGYLGTFYEQISRQSFFTLMLALSVASGLVIWVLSRALRNAVGGNA